MLQIDDIATRNAISHAIDTLQAPTKRHQQKNDILQRYLLQINDKTIRRGISGVIANPPPFTTDDGNGTDDAAATTRPSPPPPSPPPGEEKAREEEEEEGEKGQEESPQPQPVATQQQPCTQCTGLDATLAQNTPMRLHERAPATLPDPAIPVAAVIPLTPATQPSQQPAAPTPATQPSQQPAAPTPVTTPSLDLVTPQPLVAAPATQQSCTRCKGLDATLTRIKTTLSVVIDATEEKLLSHLQELVNFKQEILNELGHTGQPAVAYIKKLKSEPNNATGNHVTFTREISANLECNDGTQADIVRRPGSVASTLKKANQSQQRWTT